MSEGGGGGEEEETEKIRLEGGEDERCRKAKRDGKNGRWIIGGNLKRSR